MVTVVANGISYVPSAPVLRMIGSEPPPVRSDAHRWHLADLVEGWRYVLADPVLRPLFFNTLLVNGLIMATSPPFAVLMLGELGFGVACTGGLLGSRLVHPLVARFGRHRVMIISGALRHAAPAPRA